MMLPRALFAATVALFGFSTSADAQVSYSVEVQTKGFYEQVVITPGSNRTTTKKFAIPRSFSIYEGSNANAAFSQYWKLVTMMHAVETAAAGDFQPAIELTNFLGEYLGEMTMRGALKIADAITDIAVYVDVNLGFSTQRIRLL